MAFILRTLYRVLFWSFTGLFVLGWWLLLGMTFYWTLPVLVAGLGGSVWLRREGKFAGHKRWLIGVMVGLACFVTLWRGNTWERPIPFDDVNSAAMEYAVDDMIVFDNYELDLTNDNFVVFPPGGGLDTINLEVYFPAISSTSYSVTNAKLTLICDGDCPSKPIQAQGQGGTQENGTQSSLISPVITFEVPYDLFTQRQWYNLEATAEVTYPDVTSGETNAQTLNREARIFPGNMVDREARQALVRWQTVDNALNESPTATGLWVVGVLGVALAGWGWLAQGTFPPPPAHPLPDPVRPGHAVVLTPFTPESNTLSLDPPPIGVYVGRVEKSSAWHEVGVLHGDMLIEVNRYPVKNAQEVAKRLRQTPRNQPDALLTIWRDGEVLDLTLPLDSGRSPLQY